MQEAARQIMDALDVETFFVCSCEAEGRNLMTGLLKSWGFRDVDIVYARHEGPGTRVRGRAYIHRPSDAYGWLQSGVAQGEGK
ncbi:MAG: hypothetical protein N2491_01535 [Negativicutes bacterium]|nr:hypothetical protein [Negativicutes bacterium]